MSSKGQPVFGFSARARRTVRQPISYLMGLAVDRPDLISLAAGLVDYPTLPSDEVGAITRELLAAKSSTAKASLQYGSTRGLAPLRARLREHVASLDGIGTHELGATVEDLVITTGSQQLLFILTDILVDPLDIVITCWPSYFVYTDALKTLGAEVRCVDMDEDGMVPEALEDLLSCLDASGQIGRVKIVYLVDYHQNPTGITLSAERKPRILDIVRRYSSEHRILLIEDAAYRELTYEGETPPSIKRYDPENRDVALVQTFSKTFSPGLKTGYGVLPTDLVGPVLLQKGSHDFGSSNYDHHLIHAAVESGVYRKHVARLRESYALKRDAMLDALDQHLGPLRGLGVRWTHPRGGLYVWLTLPEGIDTEFEEPLFKTCLERGVIYVPGPCCYASDSTRTLPVNTVRLSFGAVAIDVIRRGVELLGSSLRTVLNG